VAERRDTPGGADRPPASNDRAPPGPGHTPPRANGPAEDHDDAMKGTSSHESPWAGPAADRPTPPPAAECECLRHTVVVRSPHGLHMRPAMALAQTAGRFQARVSVTRDDRRADGKSLMELMFLAAEQGSELVLEVSGSDAGPALAALADVLAALGEDDSALPPKG
jgi:phosphocarrier protein HPr